MQKAGGIIALIAAIMGVVAAFVTLFVGGVSGALQSDGADTIVNLGWRGVLFSFLCIIFGAVTIGAKSKTPATFLIVCGILGAIFGTPLVSIFMVLALVGGILAVVGTVSVPAELPQYWSINNETNSSIDKLSYRKLILSFLAICVVVILLTHFDRYDSDPTNTAPTSQSQTQTATTDQYSPSWQKRPLTPITPPQVFVSTNYSEYNNLFGMNSSLTTVQKEERFNQEFKGKRVKWTGVVSEVSEHRGTITIQIKNLDSSFGSDVSLTPNETSTEVAKHLNKGQRITYTGDLKSWSAMFENVIDNGEILP